MRTDTEVVDAPIDLDAQLLEAVRGAAREQFRHVDGIHEGLLGEQHGLLGAAADADAEHPGRTPPRTHVGNDLDHPVGHGVGRVQHGEHRLVLGPAAFRGDRDLDGLAGHELGVDHRGRVVAGTGALAGRVRHDRGTQLVVRIEIRAPHALVDHGLEVARGIPTHAHTHFDEHDDDPGILADRPMAFGAEA